MAAVGAPPHGGRAPPPGSDHGKIQSLAIAAGVAMTLKYGVDHLSKGAVDTADGDSDEDVLALEP